MWPFSRKQTVRQEVVEKMSQLVTTAFGLVSALAWHDAVKAIFAEILDKGKSAGALVTYAVTISVVAVLAAVMLGRLAQRVNDAKVMK